MFACAQVNLQVTFCVLAETEVGVLFPISLLPHDHMLNPIMFFFYFLTAEVNLLNL